MRGACFIRMQSGSLPSSLTLALEAGNYFISTIFLLVTINRTNARNSEIYRFNNKNRSVVFEFVPSENRPDDFCSGKQTGVCTLYKRQTLGEFLTQDEIEETQNEEITKMITTSEVPTTEASTTEFVFMARFPHVAMKKKVLSTTRKPNIPAEIFTTSESTTKTRTTQPTTITTKPSLKLTTEGGESHNYYTPAIESYRRLLERIRKIERKKSSNFSDPFGRKISKYVLPPSEHENDITKKATFDKFVTKISTENETFNTESRNNLKMKEMLNIIRASIPKQNSRKLPEHRINNKMVPKKTLESISSHIENALLTTITNLKKERSSKKSTHSQVEPIHARKHRKSVKNNEKEIHSSSSYGSTASPHLMKNNRKSNDRVFIDLFENYYSKEPKLNPEAKTRNFKEKEESYPWITEEPLLIPSVPAFIRSRNKQHKSRMSFLTDYLDNGGFGQSRARSALVDAAQSWPLSSKIDSKRSLEKKVPAIFYPRRKRSLYHSLSTRKRHLRISNKKDKYTKAENPLKKYHVTTENNWTEKVLRLPRQTVSEEPETEKPLENRSKKIFAVKLITLIAETMPLDDREKMLCSNFEDGETVHSRIENFRISFPQYKNEIAPMTVIKCNNKTDTEPDFKEESPHKIEKRSATKETTKRIHKSEKRVHFSSQKMDYKKTLSPKRKTFSIKMNEKTSTTVFPTASKSKKKQTTLKNQKIKTSRENYKITKSEVQMTSKTQIRRTRNTKAIPKSLKMRKTYTRINEKNVTTPSLRSFHHKETTKKMSSGKHRPESFPPLLRRRKSPSKLRIFHNHENSFSKPDDILPDNFIFLSLEDYKNVFKGKKRSFSSDLAPEIETPKPIIELKKFHGHTNLTTFTRTPHNNATDIKKTIEVLENATEKFISNTAFLSIKKSVLGNVEQPTTKQEPLCIKKILAKARETLMDQIHSEQVTTEQYDKTYLSSFFKKPEITKNIKKRSIKNKMFANSTRKISQKKHIVTLRPKLINEKRTLIIFNSSTLLTKKRNNQKYKRHHKFNKINSWEAGNFLPYKIYYKSGRGVKKTNRTVGKSDKREHRNFTSRPTWEKKLNNVGNSSRINGTEENDSNEDTSIVYQYDATKKPKRILVDESLRRRRSVLNEEDNSGSSLQRKSNFPLKKIRSKRRLRKEALGSLISLLTGKLSGKTKKDEPLKTEMTQTSKSESTTFNYTFSETSRDVSNETVSTTERTTEIHSTATRKTEAPTTQTTTASTKHLIFKQEPVTKSKFRYQSRLRRFGNGKVDKHQFPATISNSWFAIRPLAG